jgi:hypothetical protein
MGMGFRSGFAGHQYLFVFFRRVCLLAESHSLNIALYYLAIEPCKHTFLFLFTFFSAQEKLKIKTKQNKTKQKQIKIKQN